MLSKLLARWRFRTAARRFARTLPQQAHRDYGASAFYTKQQIEKSVARAGLPSGYIVFGYAMLLDKQAFDRDCSQMTTLDYEDLRAFLTRFVPSRPSAAFEPAPENSMAASGASHVSGIHN